MEYKDPEYKQPEEQFKALFKGDKKEEVTKLSCPSCGSGIPADNMNLDKAVAKCGSCDGLFSFEATLMEVKKKVKTKEEFHQIPDGIEFAQFSDGIDMRVKLKTSGSPLWMVALLIIFFVGLILFWIGVSSSGDPPPLLGHMFLGMLGVGSFIGIFDYWMQWKNYTHVAVDDHQLIVEYPGMKGNFKLEVDRTEKVYIKEGEVTAADGTTKKKVYNLFVKDDNGLETQLFKNVIYEKQVKFIEQEINNYLEERKRQVKLYGI